MAGSPSKNQSTRQPQILVEESTVIADQVGAKDIEAAWEEAKQQTSEDNLEEVSEQFQILYTSAAVSQTFEEEHMRPIEMGGGALLTYLVDVEGFEALEKWRGTGDSDKQLMANGKFQHTKGIEKTITNKYGYRNEEGSPLITESKNCYHDGEKYTLQLCPFTGAEEMIEVDVQRPDEEKDELFDYEEGETIDLGMGEITVPSLQDLFMSKLEAYDDNDREKDITDMGNIMYVVEQKYENEETELDADTLYEISKDRNLGEQYRNAMRDIENRLPHIAQGTGYAPTEDFIQI